MVRVRREAIKRSRHTESFIAYPNRSDGPAYNHAVQFAQ